MRHIKQAYETPENNFAFWHIKLCISAFDFIENCFLEFGER